MQRPSGTGLRRDTRGARLELCPATEGAAVSALENLYRSYAQSVSRWAERLGGPDLDLEDLVHDVFVVVQRRLPSFRGDSHVRTWLYGITARVVMHRRRALRRRRWLGLAAKEVADSRPTPADELQSRQASQRLYAVLDRLAEDYRTAVILYELEELSCAEIAEITGASVATVWARVSRGRKKLLRALDDRDDEEKKT